MSLYTALSGRISLPLSIAAALLWLTTGAYVSLTGARSLRVLQQPHSANRASPRRERA